MGQLGGIMAIRKRLERYIQGLKKGTGDINRKTLIMTLERFIEDSRRPPV